VAYLRSKTIPTELLLSQNLNFNSYKMYITAIFAHSR